MKIKLPLNAVLGIATEILYATFLILVAFLICLAFSLKI